MDTWQAKACPEQDAGTEQAVGRTEKNKKEETHHMYLFLIDPFCHFKFLSFNFCHFPALESSKAGTQFVLLDSMTWLLHCLWDPCGVDKAEQQALKRPK